jgi:hypothetical protein
MKVRRSALTPSVNWLEVINSVDGFGEYAG